MKKILLIIVGILFAFNANATTIPEGAVVKTANNPDVYIIKYKNGKQFKRLVLNPQVFESYGHLRWEDILIVSQSEMNLFTTSNLVRVDGQVDVYQLIPNGDIGSKHYLVSNNFDLNSVYTINDVDFGNYTMGEVKGVEDLIDNKDNDSDGLENWEEDQKGTNKNNSDTDGDGIIDGLDSHPAGGGRLMAQHFEWEYWDSIWNWDLSIPSDWYDYYKNLERKPHGAIYVTENDFYIKQIADMLSEKADEKGYSKSEFAVAFIQSLGYVSDDVIGYDDYPKYPLETLAEQNGDCEDTSYLVSAIVGAMGIDNVLVELPGHMAIAIAFSGSPEGYYYKLSNGWNYYYTETTMEGWEAGKIPNEYKNTKAKLVKIPSNSIEEKIPNYVPFTNHTPTPTPDTRLMTAINALSKLTDIKEKTKNEIDKLYAQMQTKKAEIDTNKARLAPISDIYAVDDILVDEYNNMAKVYNNKLELYKKILSMVFVIEDYRNNVYVSVENRTFLASLGIYL